MIAYCRSNQTPTDWQAVRKSLDPRRREADLYYNSRNGGTARCRDAGMVAQAIRTVAVALGAEWREYPSASWCARWRRTRSSIEAERTGRMIACEYILHIREVTGA